MLKQFVSNLILLLFVNFLVKPIWIFGIDLQVQNQVGAASYGLYASILSLSIIFNITLDLGLSHYTNRNIAQHPDRLVRSFSRLTTLKFFLALVYFILAFGTGAFLGYWHRAFLLLLFLSLNQFLLSLISFFRAHLAGLHHFRADALLSILDKSLTIILCGLFLYTGFFEQGMNVTLFAGLQTLSLGLAALLGFLMVYLKAGFFTVKFQWGEFIARLRDSFPYALLILLMALYTRVDSVMLQQLRGDFENGVYAQAFRLLDAANQPAYLFSILLMPMFAGMLARRESVQRLSQLAFSLLVVLTLGLALAAAQNAEGLMGFLYRQHAELSAPVFQVLIFSALGFGTTYVFGTLLTAGGKLRLLNAIALTGFGLNVLLNFLLIPRFGAMGAASATVVTQGATAAVQLWWALRSLDLSYGRSYWLRLAALVVLLVITAWLGAYLYDWSWWQRFFLQLVASLTLAGFLRLLPLRDGYQLLVARLRDNQSG